MLSYTFHPLAEAELDEAVGYYEAIQPGKGLELAQQIQSAIEQIRLNGRDALQSWLAVAQEFGDGIPKPFSSASGRFVHRK